MLNIPDRILLRVQKPARYTGGEYNSIVKSHDTVDVRFALAFPDIYEIGMSNLGIRILYHILNSRDDTLCERTFAPWTDMEAEMRANSIPLFALESKTPIIDFDILGFSLGYELSYTNVLNMLDLARIPLYAADRDSRHPLVIAGGCCMYNPEPMANFFDAIVIGEGEEVINEIVDTYKECRNAPRGEILLELAKIKGVYVPSFYDVDYHTSGTISQISANHTDIPNRITKRLVLNLNKAPYPIAPVVPYIDTVHNRIALEIMRGCSRGCRFCQAGMVYRPVRIRTPETLKKLADSSLANTGYDEISLMSLSSSDYPDINGLVKDFISAYEDRKIGVSLPSIRADAECVTLASEIQRVRKSGLTLAPEAGTQHLRDTINKNVTEEDLIYAVDAAFAYGWRHIKLYFMIGLPDETDDDILGIADVATKVIQTAQNRGIRPTISISVANFVPKPHTPFQWRAQDTIQELERKQDLLKKSIRSKKIQLSWHSAKVSNLESIFSRGDRRLGKAIYLAWQAGCKMDAWHEYFDHEKWMSAMENAGLDPVFYANRTRDYSEILPWDHISSGVNKNFLIKEDMSANEAITTPDCRLGGKCLNCGIIEIIQDCDESKDGVTDVPCTAKS